MIQIDPSNIDTDKIRDAAKRIDAGSLVAFPTETVYGIACRAEKESLDKLSSLKERSAEKHFTLHIADPNDARTYVPTIRLNAQKLILNAWPGPLTIVFELDASDMDRQQEKLERDVFESLYKSPTIGIRCPDDPVAQQLLQLTLHPVVAPSANLAGEPPAVNGEQALRSLAGRIDMVLDAGPSKYGTNSTVVKIGKKGPEILRAGLMSEEDVRTLSMVKFLFVCTGNTCRSPMAEGIFKKYLAEKLHANIDEIEKIGYTVESAGMMGSVGFPASPQSVMACAARGVDITTHRNQALTERLIEESDFIFVMDSGHYKGVVSLAPEAAGRCMLLDENGSVSDPIGQSQDVYDRCADQIEVAVMKRLSELVI